MAALDHVELTKSYGSSRPVKSPPMAPLGHMVLTKTQKLLESKNKKQNEHKNLNSF